jgi:prepilin signal peptidase PulO-like enzyme (type II secretory pathway)
MPPPFDMLWFRIGAGLVIGLCLGSFITMLSFRLPRRMSIIWPPSHCPKCHAHLTPRDLVPVVSWLIGKGRCRHCGAKIGARYILIELATGILSAAVFAFIGISAWLIPALVMIIVLMTATVIQYEKRYKV